MKTVFERRSQIAKRSVVLPPTRWPVIWLRPYGFEVDASGLQTRQLEVYKGAQYPGSTSDLIMIMGHVTRSSHFNELNSLATSVILVLLRVSSVLDFLVTLHSFCTHPVPAKLLAHRAPICTKTNVPSNG